MPAAHACRSITGADEMIWNQMNEMNEGKWRIEICGKGKLEKPREKLPKLMMNYLFNYYFYIN